MTLSTILIGILPSVFFGVATTLMGKTGGSDRQRVMGAVLGGLGVVRKLLTVCLCGCCPGRLV